MEQGESKDLISRILGVSLGSLYKWQERSRRGEDLKTKFRSGRPRTITDEQLTELSRLLSEGAVAHGWENNLWTSARVREVIKKHFGIEFSRWHVWRILTSYLGWTARRPVQQTKRRDETAIELWKANDLHRIVLDSEKRGDHLVFIDETGFMMTPTIRRTFAAPGVTPINKVSDPHGRISVIGAVSISPKSKRLGWHYHLLNDNRNFRGAQCRRVLEVLGRGSRKFHDDYLGLNHYPLVRCRSRVHGYASQNCERVFPAICTGIKSSGSGMVLHKVRPPSELHSGDDSPATELC